MGTSHRIAALVGLAVSVIFSITAYASLLMLSSWTQFSRFISGRYGEIWIILIYATALHAVAGGFYLIFRNRAIKRRPTWGQTTGSSVILGAVVWIGHYAVMIGMAAAQPGETLSDILSNINPTSPMLHWYLSGPLCFMTGAVVGELIERALDDVHHS